MTFKRNEIAKGLFVYDGEYNNKKYRIIKNEYNVWDLLVFNGIKYVNARLPYLRHDTKKDLTTWINNQIRDGEFHE